LLCALLLLLQGDRLAVHAQELRTTQHARHEAARFHQTGDCGHARQELAPGGL